MEDKNQTKTNKTKGSKELGETNVKAYNAFPEAVIETIDYIDEYTKAPSAKQEAMIVNAARLLATHTLDDKSDEELLEITNNQPVFSELNLYHEDQEVLVAKSASVRSLIESLTL